MLFFGKDDGICNTQTTTRSANVSHVRFTGGGCPLSAGLSVIELFSLLEVSGYCQTGVLPSQLPLEGSSTLINAIE